MDEGGLLSSLGAEKCHRNNLQTLEKPAPVLVFGCFASQLIE